MNVIIDNLSLNYDLSSDLPPVNRISMNVILLLSPLASLVQGCFISEIFKRIPELKDALKDAPSYILSFPEGILDSKQDLRDHINGKIFQREALWMATSPLHAYVEYIASSRGNFYKATEESGLLTFPSFYAAQSFFQQHLDALHSGVKEECSTSQETIDEPDFVDLVDVDLESSSEATQEVSPRYYFFMKQIQYCEEVFNILCRHSEVFIKKPSKMFSGANLCVGLDFSWLKVSFFGDFPSPLPFSSNLSNNILPPFDNEDEATLELSNSLPLILKYTVSNDPQMQLIDVDMLLCLTSTLVSGPHLPNSMLHFEDVLTVLSKGHKTIIYDQNEFHMNSESIGIDGNVSVMMLNEIERKLIKRTDLKQCIGFIKVLVDLLMDQNRLIVNAAGDFGSVQSSFEMSIPYLICKGNLKGRFLNIVGLDTDNKHIHPNSNQPGGDFNLSSRTLCAPSVLTEVEAHHVYTSTTANAATIVAGYATIIKTWYPDLTWTQVCDCLLYTSIPIVMLPYGNTELEVPYALEEICAFEFAVGYQFSYKNTLLKITETMFNTSRRKYGMGLVNPTLALKSAARIKTH